MGGGGRGLQGGFKWTPSGTATGLHTSTKSDQSQFSAWRNDGPLATHRVSIEDLIRLCGCAGWSEFSMGAHANLYLVWTLAPVILLRQIWGQISAPWAKTSQKWWIYIMQKLLLDLIFYVPVNSFSVMSWQVYLCWTSTKLRIMCLAHGNKAVPPVRLHPTTIWSRVKHSTTELSPWYMQKPADMDLHCFQKRL